MTEARCQHSLGMPPFLVSKKERGFSSSRIKRKEKTSLALPLFGQETKRKPQRDRERERRGESEEREEDFAEGRRIFLSVLFLLFSSGQSGQGGSCVLKQGERDRPTKRSSSAERRKENFLFLSLSPSRLSRRLFLFFQSPDIFLFL